MTDDEIFEIQARVANSIVLKLSQTHRDTLVTKAIDLLLRRIANACNSLRILREHSSHDCTFDGAMILRSVYDAMLQSLYILADDTSRDERAQLFLDYYWIEKETAIALYDRSPTYLGKRMAKSPRRHAAEPEIRQRIQAVRWKYVDKIGKTRNHWYKGDLRSLAVAAGLESEYELFQKNFSGVVHSSSYVLMEGMRIDGLLLEDYAQRFSFRILKRFAVYSGVALDKMEMEFIQRSEKNIFGDPSKPKSSTRQV